MILIIPTSFNHKLIAIIISLLFYSLFLVWASSSINSHFYIKCINKNKDVFNKIAITFDDGPCATNTPIILQLLDKYNAKATFFMIGKNANQNIDLVKEIYSKNHSIGNHSYTHTSLFPLKRFSKIYYEINYTNQILKNITGTDISIFRPPFGVTNPTIAKAIIKLNLTVIGWSIRSFDTQNENSEKVFKRIISKLGNGDIILLHDTSKNIVEILEKLLIYLEINKIKSITVQELIATKNN